ncbi:glycoside hydrolase family 16 protein [Paeniglutamicibacter gangotriensis]|nr:glycoside hydrolase family 16 protein [Paeniglutamicibacter gangotriensis]
MSWASGGPNDSVVRSPALQPWGERSDAGTVRHDRKSCMEGWPVAGHDRYSYHRVMGRKREVFGSVTGLIALALLSGCTSQVPDENPGSTQIQPTDGLNSGIHPDAASTDGMLLDEGFDENTLDASLWNTCHWWQDDGCTIATNNELEWYLPRQVKVSEGALHLTAERSAISASDGKDYRFASGMVTTGPPAHQRAPRLAFTYGKVEVRFRLPAGRGLWPAIWLLPASENSRPEIDMLEVTGEDTGRLRLHLHPKDDSAPSIGKDYLLPGGASLAGGWHTIGLDWSPGRLDFILDGKRVWRLDGKEVPDEPMYLVMNLAVGGEYPGDPDQSTRFPATMSIDHVRIRRND